MKRFMAILLSAMMLFSLTTFANAEDTSLKVAVCIAEALGDLGFNDSADAGLKQLEADYGLERTAQLIEMLISLAELAEPKAD